jgi:hypothetical protein
LESAINQQQHGLTCLFIGQGYGCLPSWGILPRLLPQNEMHNNLQKKSISMLFGQAAELSYTA